MSAHNNGFFWHFNDPEQYLSGGGALSTNPGINHYGTTEDGVSHLHLGFGGIEASDGVNDESKSLYERFINANDWVMSDNIYEYYYDFFLRIMKQSVSVLSF